MIIHDLQRYLSPRGPSVNLADQSKDLLFPSHLPEHRARSCSYGRRPPGSGPCRPKTVLLAMIRLPISTRPESSRLGKNIGPNIEHRTLLADNLRLDQSKAACTNEQHDVDLQEREMEMGGQGDSAGWLT